MLTHDLPWLAGILEGEGCFHIRAGRTARATPCPVIDLTMGDKDIVERAAKLMGGRINPKPDQRKPHYTPMWRTTVEGARAAGVMMTIYKFLGMRRAAKVAAVLAEWKAHPYRKAPKGTHNVSECEHPGRAVAKYVDGVGVCHTCYCRTYRETGLLSLKREE